MSSLLTFMKRNSHHVLLVGRQALYHVGKPYKTGLVEKKLSYHYRRNARPFPRHLPLPASSAVIVVFIVELYEPLQRPVGLKPLRYLVVAEPCPLYLFRLKPEKQMKQIVSVPSVQGPGKAKRLPRRGEQGAHGQTLQGTSGLVIVDLIQNYKIEEPFKVSLDELGRCGPFGFVVSLP